MDVLLLLMGLTLAAAGWLLIRDYTRFVYSTYSSRGRVVSMEPGYWPSAYSPSEYRAPGYFPVIEYYWNGESSRFTALMAEAVGTLQMGDLVTVQVSRSRRSRGRLGRGVLVLIALLGSLVTLLMLGAVVKSQELSMLHVCLASLVLAVCLFIIVLYFRLQDESMPGPNPHVRRSTQLSLCLQEPTAPRHWCRFRVSRDQRTRILYSRLFGGSCVAAGILFVLASVQSARPDLSLHIQENILSGKIQPLALGTGPKA